MRAELTWQMIDHELHQVCFGGPEDLKGKVSVPKDFIARRSQVAIVASDQVPTWVARQGAKTVFAAHEKVRCSKEARQLVGDKKVVMRVSDIRGQPDHSREDQGARRAVSSGWA